ncbi:MAG: sugar ABC transporter substrate-binding protein, partial [Spirochaetales bacterium]|nr:sugar ABC transporter substrate-binding protein [Spirochaetales bacterium]
MKKLLVSLIGILTAATLWAAGHEEQAEDRDDGVYRIAYIARAQGDSFAAWLANAVIEEVEGYDELEVTVFDGQSRNELIAEHI